MNAHMTKHVIMKSVLTHVAQANVVRVQNVWHNNIEPFAIVQLELKEIQ